MKLSQNDMLRQQEHRNLNPDSAPAHAGVKQVWVYPVASVKLSRVRACLLMVLSYRQNNNIMLIHLCMTILCRYPSLSTKAFRCLY